MCTYTQTSYVHKEPVLVCSARRRLGKDASDMEDAVISYVNICLAVYKLAKANILQVGETGRMSIALGVELLVVSKQM